VKRSSPLTLLSKNEAKTRNTKIKFSVILEFEIFKKLVSKTQVLREVESNILYA
jgi:hypothetical protein